MFLKLTYTNGEKTLTLRPLKGEIDPDSSQFTVGKYKVEIKLKKRILGKWGTLEGDMPDGAHTFGIRAVRRQLRPFPSPATNGGSCRTG